MIFLDPAKDERIMRLGRTGEKKDPFPMHWTGSGAVIRTACVSLDVRLKAEYLSQAPWAAVLADVVGNEGIIIEENVRTLDADVVDPPLLPEQLFDLLRQGPVHVAPEALVGVDIWHGRPPIRKGPARLRKWFPQWRFCGTIYRQTRFIHDSTK